MFWCSPLRDNLLFLRAHIVISLPSGIDPNLAQEGTCSAVFIAAMNGHSKVLRALIDHKVTISCFQNTYTHFLHQFRFDLCEL